MPDAPILGASKQVTLDGDAFGARFHGPLVHETVRAEQAARRQGTAATKTRGMVSGGGAKPWRQKTPSRVGRPNMATDRLMQLGVSGWA